MMALPSANTMPPVFCRQQEMKDTMLSALLTQDARARRKLLTGVKPIGVSQVPNVLQRVRILGPVLYAKSWYHARAVRDNTFPSLPRNAEM
jgi:hypothetical protein